MARYFRTYGAITAVQLAAHVTTLLNDIGATATSSSSTVTISSWNDISGETFGMPGTASQANGAYVYIDDTAGAEVIFVVQAFSNTRIINAGTNGIGVFANLSSGVLSVTASSTNVAYIIPVLLNVFEQVDNLRISQVLTMGTANSTTSGTIDVYELGLYTANGLVAQNVLYTDEAGVEYIGINPWFLVKA